MMFKAHTNFDATKTFVFFLNFIHNINVLKWKFFILIIRDEYEFY